MDGNGVEDCVVKGVEEVTVETSGVDGVSSAEYLLLVGIEGCGGWVVFVSVLMCL